MAISSPLRPEVIAPFRRANALSAQSFISGGAPLGSSILATAANKIVGFQRGASTGVSPQVPDLQSIIQTLSSNILNNVENRVQSINQNVTQIVQKLTKDLEGDYRQKVLNLDAITPNKILQNFLSLYEKAIGYIQFFADKNNIRRLGDNLDDLTDVFKETFEVAKNIRRTIVRIVDQLSKLPQAGVGAGGALNLDVDIPGGNLRKGGGGNFLRMMRKRPGLMLGGAALAGAGATKVVSAMASPGGNVQSTPTSDPSAGLSGPVLDRFNAILDRFNSAISSLANIKPPKQEAKVEQSTGTSDQSEDTTESGSTGVSGVASDVTADTKEEMAWLQTLRKVEGTSGQDGYGKVFGGQVVKELAEGKLTVEEAAKMSETGKLPDRLGGKQIAYGKYGGKVSGATGAYQFMPGTLRAAARRAGVDLNAPMTPEVQDKLALAHLQAIGIDPKKAATEATIRKAGGSAGWAGVHGEATGQTKRTVKESLSIYNQYYSGASPTQKSQMMAAKPTVAPGKTQSTTQREIAQTVAQPPTSQSKPQVNFLPLSMGSQQPQSQGKPPATSAGTTPVDGVPFLAPGNPDNFLTFYSKMVYNIVDG